MIERACTRKREQREAEALLFRGGVLRVVVCTRVHKLTGARKHQYRVLSSWEGQTAVADPCDSVVFMKAFTRPASRHVGLPERDSDGLHSRQEGGQHDTHDSAVDPNCGALRSTLSWGSVSRSDGKGRQGGEGSEEGVIGRGHRNKKKGQGIPVGQS